MSLSAEIGQTVVGCEIVIIYVYDPAKDRRRQLCRAVQVRFIKMIEKHENSYLLNQNLFVQTFQSGTISAASDASDTHTHSVTLQGGSGQTVYFADRPARDVGAVPTDQFFTGLGFEAENPPNAAMVLEIENGDTDIAVVELYNPAIGDDGSVSYDVGELDTWRATLDMDFSEQPTDLADLAPSFGAAHLFIDDCADGDPVCWNYPERNGVNLGTRGRCWSWAGLRCTWCFIEQYARECNEMFPDHCKGECYVEG